MQRKPFFLIWKFKFTFFLVFYKKNIQIHFYLVDVANCMGDWEICSASGSLLDNLIEFVTALHLDGNTCGTVNTKLPIRFLKYHSCQRVLIRRWDLGTSTRLDNSQYLLLLNWI